jgi:hypothetical protein
MGDIFSRVQRQYDRELPEDSRTDEEIEQDAADRIEEYKALCKEKKE